MNIYEVCSPEIKTKAAFSGHIEVKTNKTWRRQQESPKETLIAGVKTRSASPLEYSAGLGDARPQEF